MAKKVAFFGVFASLAIIISYIERLFPLPIPLPGVKLGLANVVVVVAMYVVSVRAALAISVIRIVIVGFLFGSIFSIAYSIVGGLASFFVMVLAKKVGFFGIVGVSVLGGVFHNIGQIFVAALIVQNMRLFYYSPALIIAGVVTGCAIGFAAGHSINYLKQMH